MQSSCVQRADFQPAAKSAGRLQFHLNYKTPFAWHSLTEFFRNRAIDDIETITPEKYSRALQLGKNFGVIEVENQPDHHCLVLTIPRGFAKHATQVIESAKRVFDLNADPAALQEKFSKNRYLRKIAAAMPGLRVPGAWNWFEIAVRAILGQQVTVKAARTIATRLVRRVHAQSEPVPCSLPFPEPQAVLNARLDGLGVPQRRIDAIYEIAKAASWIQSPESGVNPDEIVRQLCELPGIGPWTAHYIALRGFGHQDAFPPGDLVLKQTVSMICGKQLTDSNLQSIADAWRPWRGYAVIYLWAYSNMMRNAAAIK